MIKEFYTSKLLSNHKSKILESVTPFNINEGGEIVGDIGGDLALEAMILSLTETLQEYIDSNTEAVQLNEGVAQVVRKVKDSVAKTVVKFTLADKEMSERVNEKFNRYIKIFRDSKRDAAYDGIVKNAVNLSKMLKNLIGSFILGLLIPGGISVKIVSAVLALLIKTAMDKRSDSKYKNLVFNDLKFEITVVKEKIRDAESRGDIKAKYKLMRIENQLGRAMNRLQYNIKD
jgi:hypothetical protein